jgi:type IV pilus assembly protein PilC
MAIFKYTAKNEHGETVKGKVEARNENAAAAILNSRDLIVISVKPLSDSALSSVRGLFMGVKQDDIVNFTRQLSTMITAGLPLSGAMSILADQTNVEMGALVNELLREIEGGSSFATALEKKPKIFSRVYVQLVRAGEAGGVLDQVLAKLADNLEKQKAFRGKIKGALIYPIIVIFALVIVAFVMMVVVIPKLTQMYEDFGSELPFVTQVLINVSDFFVDFWWLAIAGGIGGFIGFSNWRKTQVGERAFDELLLRIPVFGVLRKKVILTDFSRTLSLLLGAGVSLIEALDIVSEAMDSIIYRSTLKGVTKQVEKGEALSAALSMHKTFPSILYQMISVGEETGKLDDVLLKISMYFEAESEQAVKNLTTALEPMIMIVLGVGVGFMVIAIIMPIYNLTSQF